MPMHPRLFFDSSALISGVISSRGAARALLLLSEVESITIIVSEQVVAETERALARKAVRAIPYYREALRASKIRIVRDPPLDEVRKHQGIIRDASDAPIVLAAMRAGMEYLVTLNRRHFLDDFLVASRSGLRIGTPGDALAWIRSSLASVED